MKIHKRQTQKHLESHDLEIWPRGHFCRTQTVLPCLCPLDRLADVWEFRASVCRKWTLSSGEVVWRRSEATKKHCHMRDVSSEICLLRSPGLGVRGACRWDATPQLTVALDVGVDVRLLTLDRCERISRAAYLAELRSGTLIGWREDVYV